MSNFGECKQYNFTVSCTWNIEDQNKTLQDSITVDTSNGSVELEDIVQLETCVQLQAHDETDEDKHKQPCTITISLPDQSMQLINRLSVVSEARIIEVFGRGGEYVTTCVAEYVDDFEDCAVYLATCTIKPIDELTIKFQKTKHPGSLWIYGINLHFVQKTACPSFSSINFQSVNEMLKDVRIPLSENAEKCKSFLQAYSGAPDFSKTRTPNAQLLMKMLETGYLNPLSETGKNMTKCVTNFLPFLSKDVENVMASEPEVGGSFTTNGQSSEVLILKNYIDRRFNQIENKIDRLEQSVREMEKRQNDKLDHIIALLSK